MNDKFRNWLMVNGSSYNTALNYEGRIEHVIAKIDPENLTKEPIQAFLLGLQGKHKASTINGYLNAIKAYLKFLGKSTELPKALKEPRTLPDSFTEEYLENTILPTISQLFCYDYLKYRALFYFLFFGGLRISEAGHLERKNIDLEKRIAKIYVQKTRQERIIFFNEKTRQALEEYFDFEPEITNAFNNNTDSIKKRVQRLKQYFPEINIHPHLFRNSYALNLLRKGVDLLTVSKLLGHANINSTMRYLGLTTDQMQEIYNKKIK